MSKRKIFRALSANAIGCFVCTSLNRGNKGCEDTFNNTGKYYRSDCQANRDGRIGTFPATQCIKMVAEDGKCQITGFGFVTCNGTCIADWRIL